MGTEDITRGIERIAQNVRQLGAITVRWAVRSIGEDRDRWPLFIPVLMAIGIGLYFALPAEPPLWSGAIWLGVIGSATWILRRREAIYLALLTVTIISVGFGAALLRTNLVQAPILVAETGPTSVTGRIAWIGAGDGRQRIVLEQLTIGSLAPVDTPARVRVSAPVPALSAHGTADGVGGVTELASGATTIDYRPLPGDWITARVVLRPPSAPVIPGAWDFARQAFFQKIGGVGFTLGYVRHVDHPAGEAGGSFGGWLAGARNAIAGRVLAVDSGAAGGLAAALLTGDRSAIPKPTIDAMRGSGLAHLLAISGLHIGLVAGILFFTARGLLALFEPVALRYPIKKWAAMCAIIGALIYVLLAGASIPTQRAFLMTGLIMAAVLVDRSSLSVRLIAWAAAILLLIAPESLLGPSFQMSFAAATALVAVYEVLRRHFSRWAGEGSLARVPMIYIAGIGITTLVAGLATGPFALMHFGRFADYGLIANLVAVPLTALWVMPFGVISLVLMPFGGEVIGLVPMLWGLEGVAYIAQAISNLPGAVSLAPAMPTAALVAVALAGCWLCIWRQTGLRLLGIVGIVAGGVIWSTAERPDILISSDGKLVALRDQAGALRLSDERESRFAAEMWLRRNAQKTALYWPGSSNSEHANIGDTNMRCDALACSADYKGQKLAFIHQPDALMEDCGLADVVVASVPILQQCDGPSTIIDRFDLWRSGAHAVYLNSESGARIETVAQIRGARPWVLPPISTAQRKPKAADQP